MATLPIHLLQSIEKYGTSASPVDFKDICEKLCQKLINDDPSKSAGVLVEAARRGLSVTTLEELLPKNELSNAIISVFKENGQSIQKCMAEIGWEPPRVVDVSWKLSKTLETDKGTKEMAVAEIHLDTIPTGSAVLERISFCCSSDDLQVNQPKKLFTLSRCSIEFEGDYTMDMWYTRNFQNILWKLKEAQNAVLNMKSYE